jgi:hypothetical protein
MTRSTTEAMTVPTRQRKGPIRYGFDGTQGHGYLDQAYDAPIHYGYDGTQGHGYLAQAYKHQLIPSLYLDAGLISCLMDGLLSLVQSAK